MKNSNHFYVIVGASATGKGSLINQLVKEKKWVRAKKYSTRDYRGADDDIVLFEDEELKQIEQELADLNYTTKKET